MEYIEEPVDIHEEVTEKKLLDALARQLGPQRFGMWFGSETTIRREGEKLVVGVSNPFAADWIRANFSRDIEQASLTVLGRSFPVTCSVLQASATEKSNGRQQPTHPVSVPTRAAAPEAATVAISGKPITEPSRRTIGPHFNRGPLVRPSIETERLDEVIQIDRGSPISASRPASPVSGLAGRPRSEQAGRRFASLETFVEGLSNRLACRAAEIAVEHPGKINPIYIHGPTSVGKTHLLEGIWTAVVRKSGRKSPFYMTSEQFIFSYLESIQRNSSRSDFQSFRNKFKGISIFLLDDIQYLSRKDATQTEFLITLDTLRKNGVQVVLTGDRPLEELTGLRNEIRCRLEAGMVCSIEQPERETALAIFQNMVRQRGLPIGPEVCRMVTSRLGVHARQLSGALNRLHAVHLASDEPITLEQAEKALGDLIQSTRRNVRIRDIEKAVCDTFGLSEEALQSKSKVKQVVAPRMLAMWLARKHTRSALSEIGKYFGNRSHSTVVTAQKKVDQWIDQDHPIHGDSLDVPVSEAIRKIERLLQLMPN